MKLSNLCGWTSGCAAILLISAGLAAETIPVPGHGEVPVPVVPKKKLAEANQQALANAEGLAVGDAITQAVFRVFGTRQKLGLRADEVLADTVRHSAAFVRSSEVRGRGVQNGMAVVDVLVQIDGAALREHLENTLETSLTEKTEGKFKVFVLAYTVEGGDPNRSQPQVLHDEIYAQSTSAQAKDAAHASTEASASGTDYHDRSAHRDSSASASEEQMARARAEQDDLFGTAARSAAARSAQQKQRSDSAGATATDLNSADARYRHDAGASRERAFSNNTFIRITDFADTSKKGTGVTNEVRAKLTEMLTNAGLVTNFYNLELMNKQFPTEDELYTLVLDKVNSDPKVKPNDYVAVALNRLTPLPGVPHRYTSQTTYRVIRVSDQQTFLPDKNVIGDSGDQASDDLARTTATEMALERASEQLPGELDKAIKRWEREQNRSGAEVSSSYVIEVDNVTAPAASAALKQALRNAGFNLQQQFRRNAMTETITVELNGRPGSQVRAIVESNLGSLDVSSLDEHSAVLAGPK